MGEGSEGVKRAAAAVVAVAVVVVAAVVAVVASGVKVAKERKQAMKEAAAAKQALQITRTGHPAILPHLQSVRQRSGRRRATEQLPG